MFSQIDSLQNKIVEKLKLCPPLNKFRIIKEEALCPTDTTSYGNTTSIVVKIPQPLSASSGFSNFNFSQIAISIAIISPRMTSGNINSPIAIAEYISKKLHSWQANTNKGECSICINQSTPWQEYIIDEQLFSLTINFTSQSIA